MGHSEQIYLASVHSCQKRWTLDKYCWKSEHLSNAADGIARMSYKNTNRSVESMSMIRNRIILLVILFLTLSQHPFAYASDRSPDLSQESVTKIDKRISSEGAAAKKALDALEASFKTWMYDSDEMSTTDELTGKRHSATSHEAILFARHPREDGRRLSLFITATTSDAKYLREKTNVWFQASDGGVISESSNKSYCTERICPMRVRFDNRAPILFDMKSRPDGKYFEVKDPLRFIKEIKKSKVAMVEVPYVDDSEKLTMRIFAFDVGGLKWNISE
jgi:hypothetical protein